MTMPHAQPSSHGSRLLLAGAVLVALTLTSFGLARVHLGAAATPLALGIAALKASIVALAFMELGRASAPARITAAVTIAFIALLCAGIVGDVGVR